MSSLSSFSSRSSSELSAGGGPTFSVSDGKIKSLKPSENPVYLNGSVGLRRAITNAPAKNLDRSTSYYETTKRGVDIFGASVLLVLLSPLMLCLCFAVRLTSRGPAIYTQRRLTQGKKVFHMYKFRTMVNDAESKTGPVWTASTDPRITPIGRFLRLSRLDELPQLLNVVIGDMSLIGPRPERPEFAAELSGELPSFYRRLEVKAGITGLAQVGPGYASNLQAYRKKLAFDLMYIKHRCLLLDLRIAAKTVLVIITGTGAR